MKPDLRPGTLTVCRYKCGECDHESVDRWGVHQTHYEQHRLDELGVSVASGADVD